jgi:Cadherin-like beta sandwich domain
MKHALAIVRQCLTVILLLILGVSPYGCKDTVSVSNDIQVPLASLTITPGTLQPAFSSNTTSYTVDAPTSATSVTVTASPKDSTTTMTINGGPATAGQGSSTVSLGQPGSTTPIRIVLSSQTGTESTYTVTVTRLLSSDNNLSGLQVSVGTSAQTLSPKFAAGTLTYTVDVATAVTEVTVTATKSDPSAVLSGAVPNEGRATIPLDGPGTSKTISITVTAPSGVFKTYTITITRLSNDNNLSALTVNAGAFALDPAFTAGTLSYTVNVPIALENVTISATKSDPNAVMALVSVTVAAGTATGETTIPLNGIGAPTSASITVTAPSGDVKTYTVTINRVLI